MLCCTLINTLRIYAVAITYIIIIIIITIIIYMIVSAASM